MLSLGINQSTGELRVENGNMVIVDGIDSDRQDLETFLRLFQGEWFLDETEGVPYFQEILKKNPNLITVDALFKAAILGRPSVTSLTTFNLNFDNAARELFLDFTALTGSGQIDFSGGLP